jgi:hypothetical protein
MKPLLLLLVLVVHAFADELVTCQPDPPPASTTVAPGGNTCSEAQEFVQNGRIVATQFPGLPDLIFMQGSSPTATQNGSVWTLTDPGFTPSTPTLAIQRAVQLGLYPNSNFTTVLSGTEVTVSQAISTSVTSIGSFVFASHTTIITTTLTQTKWTLTQPSQAIDVTGQVRLTYTGFVRNRATGIWSTMITVTNIGGTPIPGPIHVLLSNISVGAAVTNYASTSQGNPYLTVTTGSLPSQGSVTASLQFTNPSGGYIAFSTTVLSGAL